MRVSLGEKFFQIDQFGSIKIQPKKNRPQYEALRNNRKLNETYLKLMSDWDSAESSVAQEVT